MNFPSVSLIIPTHNRCDQLQRTLSALSRQTYPSDRMEILIVADNCTDGTVSFARQYQAPWKKDVLEQPGLGAAAARNRGASVAKGTILIFLDDDMEVVPGFIMAHVIKLLDHPQTVCIGALNVVDQYPKRYLERSLKNWWEHKFFRMRQPGYRFRYDDLFGGNFSVWADFFHQVGGFDPALRCHEDYELAVRLLDAGAKFKLAVEAAATHHETTSLSRAFQRRIAEGQADVYLIERHPGLHWGMPLAVPPFTIIGRIFRWFAFRQRTLGDLLIHTLRWALPLFEFLWLLGFWQILFYHIQDYWYWCGVGAILEPAELEQLILKKKNPSLPLNVNLSAGLPVVEHQVGIRRPSSIRFFLGRQWVGEVPDLPGMERLWEEHVRRILSTEFSEQLATALALDLLNPGTGDDTWQTQWLSSPEPHVQTDSGVNTEAAKKIFEIDLADGIADVDITGYDGLYVFVRSHGRPLGNFTMADLPARLVPAVMIQKALMKCLGTAARQLAWVPQPLMKDTVPPMPISVVVCTRNRTFHLAECLKVLLSLDYPLYEIVVVDNAPDDGQTELLVSDLPVRYVREDRPGLDWARNCGLQEAQHSIVAFTDDDARPDPGWLRALAAAFEDEDVMIVTGPVLPAVLETGSQNLFEFGYGGMNHGFSRRIIRRSAIKNMDLLWASSFGAGANMAFRKKVFEIEARFDVALDVGTPSRGGGDVEMFHRLVANGHALVYEPTALMWHHHRPEMSDLKQLIRNNGRSFGCYLLTNIRNRTMPLGSILYFALRFWLLDWIIKRLVIPRPGDVPRGLTWQELLSALGSPFAYILSQLNARRYATPSPEMHFLKGKGADQYANKL